MSGKLKKKSKPFTCLDVGSSRLICIIAEITEDEIKIIGYGHKESRGLIGCNISDMRLAQKSIISTVAEAEKMAGISIKDITLIVSSAQTTSSHQDSSIKIAGNTIKSSDIISLTNKIREYFRKNNHEIFHFIPLQYRIDDSLPIVNPHHMSGDTLYTKFHIISASQTTIKNIEKCLKECQLSIDNYLIEPYSSLFATLTENEMHLGSMIIDIGSFNTSFGLVIDGKFTHSANFPIAGAHITKDIATILNISLTLAEKIKNLNNSLIISPIEAKDLINLRNINESDGSDLIKISKSDLAEIIKSRLEEIFENIKKVAYKNKIPISLVNNVVITGGSATIVGAERLASEVLNKNARIGYPNKIKNLDFEINNPGHASVLGALTIFQNNYIKNKNKAIEPEKQGIINRIINKIASL